MSNALAIAAVTRTLRGVISRAVLESVPGDVPADVRPINQIQVTTLPLDKVREVNTNGNVVNLFLYNTIPNAALRNLGFGSSGAPFGPVDSQLVLSLHYVISAYGQDNNELLSHLLLGRAMLALHDNAVLIPSDIVDALGGSGLQDQVERVRITPHPLNFEEMSKLWMAFQTQYRISAAYEVSAVLMESTRPRVTAPPVKAPNVVVAPLDVPVVERVDPQLASAGAALRIIGANLADPAIKVRIGSFLLSPDSATSTALAITLPASIPAGAATLQVVQARALGVPPVDHPGAGFTSNSVTFAVVPQITTSATLAAARGSTLSLTVTPPIAAGQRVSLVIGQRELAAAPRLPSDPPFGGTVSFPIADDFPTGTFLVRVVVDGVASALKSDSSSSQCVGPTVKIT